MAQLRPVTVASRVWTRLEAVAVLLRPKGSGPTGREVALAVADEINHGKALTELLGRREKRRINLLINTNTYHVQCTQGEFIA